MKRLQTLALEQKEDARHGDATFPIQKYITSLKPDYPVVTTHWHEEAEFTLITEGDASYQIDLTSYAVEKDDLIFIPPLLLHSVSRGQSALYQSETYVFHMNFLGGNATDICSTRYLMSEPGSEGYAASKGGIYSLTHALASSLSEWHITVNSIAPGWIQTHDYNQLRPEDHSQHPSRRVGKPGDIARMCLFLCEENNDFINGDNITIDGGMTKKMIYVE